MRCAGGNTWNTSRVTSRRPAQATPAPVPGVCVDPTAPKMREACGVFGVYAPDAPVASLTYLGLFALQHRGQESAGIAVSDGETITVVKDLGLVTQVFDERRLAPLLGHLAIGHVRYSTTGSTTWENSQPVYRFAGACGFALAHNGNLTNTHRLASAAGMGPGTASSDSDLVAALVQQRYREGADPSGPERDTGPSGPERDTGLEAALLEVLPALEGAFTFVLMDERRLIGVRDPFGFRPLCLGRTDTGGWVLASETCALDIIGARLVREVEPGEMIVIDAEGVRTLTPFADVTPALCVFEFVYFARPDSQLYGRNVFGVRHRMGELLAEQAPVEADMVMPVPESGIPAAQGYARASGIPYGDGLVKNRYVGRTFIAPDQSLRERGVRMKLNPLAERIRGKRLLVVDDSIVRGSTTRQMVALLREAGAAEVHLRISSSPYRWPCFFGMDTSRRSELLAATLEVGEIRDYLGCDSLAYLDITRLLTATGIADQGFCTACLTGRYPVNVSDAAGKDVLELPEGGGSSQPAFPLPPAAGP